MSNIQIATTLRYSITCLSFLFCNASIEITFYRHVDTTLRLEFDAFIDHVRYTHKHVTSPHHQQKLERIGSKRRKDKGGRCCHLKSNKLLVT